MRSVKIKSIRPIENEPLSTVTLEIFENGEKKTERLTVFIDYCPENGIGVGTADENTIAGLVDAAKLCYAVRRGEALLSFSANSRAALESKLRARGIEADYARRAADMLAERGFVDDRENALLEAERCVRKLWGERRILSHLSGKGYRAEVLCEVSAYLEDVDFFTMCRTLIEKKYRGAISKDQKERERAYAALVRYGYSLGLVRSVASRLRASNKSDGDRYG